MAKGKRILEINNDIEHGIVVNSILELRNKYVREGRSHADIDEMLVKVYQTPTQKQKRQMDKER